MKILSHFDGGNIEIETIEGSAAALRVRKDTRADYRQWFYFQSRGEPGQPRCYKIINAGDCTYAKGWNGYCIWFSYDREDWHSLPVRFDGKVAEFVHTPEREDCRYAYFIPYSQDRHLDLITRCMTHPDVRHDLIGSSHENRPLDVLRFGRPGGDKRVCWIIASQHPGETMARWCAEGIAETLLTDAPAIRSLLDRALIYLVPDVNPDGSFHGNTRANAAGQNLNRCWKSASPLSTPEIYHLKKYMAGTGVDFFLDIHGDEEMPWCFVSGADAVPAATPAMKNLRAEFCDLLAGFNPDFQCEHGYPPEEPGEADLEIASRFIAQTYRCLSMTLEQPFQGHEPGLPGWSIAQAKRLGADCLRTLEQVVTKLRPVQAEGTTWPPARLSGEYPNWRT